MAALFDLVGFRCARGSQHLKRQEESCELPRHICDENPVGALKENCGLVAFGGIALDLSIEG